jgi:hypothetical protein
MAETMIEAQMTTGVHAKAVEFVKLFVRTS